MDFIKRAQGLHGNMAADLISNGGVLRCHECDHEQALTEAQIAQYLAHGWPKHCGYGMRWVTQRELDAEKRGD